MSDGNFISRFIQNARTHPDKIALRLPQMEGQYCVSEESVSYGDLARQISAYQSLWQQKGWQAGDRVVIILKPSKELYAIALSLFSLGIVAVFIDTGMGRQKIQMAIRDSNAKAIISMKALIKLFWFVPALWPLQRFAVDGQGIGYRNIVQQVKALMPVASALTCLDRSDTDHALISFTSGSTGRPKGADRTHFSLIQQHLAIRDHWPDESDDIDCPCFPVMVLHNLSCGMTTIMPKVDLAQPSNVNAKIVIAQIRQHNVTRLSGAPAYLQGLVNYLSQQPNELKTVSEVKSIVVGGATVSKALAESIRTAFPLAEARIVYGSTEAEPIADVSIDEYLAEPQTGYLVGHVASQIDLMIADIDELAQQEVLITEADLMQNCCSVGEIGEIFVSGHHVLKQYIDNPVANNENKIRRQGVAETKAVWHRTGDCGYRDSQGRLWLSGRINDVIRINHHRVQPYPIEQALDQEQGIRRVAVMNYEEETKNDIYIFTETAHSTLNKKQLASIAAIASDYFKALGLSHVQLVDIDKIPVDGRHNSKIDRPQLRQLLKSRSLKNTPLKNIQLLVL